MTVRTKLLLPIGLAIYPMALALAACGESDDPTSIASNAANIAIAYPAECAHLPEAADAVGHNATGDPQVVQVLTGGVEGNPPCPTLERSAEPRQEEHPPLAFREKPPSRTGQIQKALGRIAPALSRVPRR